MTKPEYPTYTEGNSLKTITWPIRLVTSEIADKEGYYIEDDFAIVDSKNMEVLGVSEWIRVTQDVMQFLVDAANDKYLRS